MTHDACPTCRNQHDPDEPHTLGTLVVGTTHDAPATKDRSAAVPETDDLGGPETTQ